MGHSGHIVYDLMRFPFKLRCFLYFKNIFFTSFGGIGWSPRRLTDDNGLRFTRKYKDHIISTGTKITFVTFLTNPRRSL